ncbi:LAQU0S08e04918g1_1 [Lachancea quebecensis]|uniref:LAQU0S08e04918g1_1 n=1 Tax=Lachancea quebecensis TaxID=1654605 RepID=A0A0P1L1S4_9SACH|nr:LAQU0S08e04918g1_1 [Lachancea quebecensis]
MSVAQSRGRSLRSDSEFASTMNNKHVSSNSGKKLRQFTTNSRSKSAASFKGFNKLRRVLSHDGALEVENYAKERPDFIKKSKSSDSLSRKRAISGLSMTTLGKVRSHPGHSSASEANGGPGSISGLHTVGLRPHRANSVKSVLALQGGDDELYEDHSTTDEEVEYFTDEEQEEQHGGQSLRARQQLRSRSRQKQKVNSDRVDDELQRLASRSLREDQTLTGSLKEVSDSLDQAATDEELRREDSNKTIGNNQLHYGVPSNLRDADEDHIGNGDHIDAGDHINNEDHIDQGNPDEDTINANSNIETIANSLKRHGPTTRSDELVYGNGAATEDAQNHSLQSTGRFSPVMILSQSTGVEKRFDRPANITEDSIPQRYHNNNKEQAPENRTESNNFNYINSDFTASYASSNIPERQPQNAPKPDFSTSISSLSSHLHKPAQAAADNRTTSILHQRAPQVSLPATNGSGSRSEGHSSTANRPDPLSNFNNFSQFLQSETSGAVSRTQQKLWLQRENSIMDLSSTNTSADAIFLASNIEVKREFERISREYTNVRRFSNPLNASLNRVIPRSKLEVKKHRSPFSQGDELSKVFKNEFSKDAKTFKEFCRENLNQKLDIDRVLAKIWNEESEDFNKESELLGDNEPEGPSSVPAGQRPHNRHSLRNNGPASNTSHLRTVSSLQPTTRAVHRRMESALSQQQRL